MKMRNLYNKVWVALLACCTFTACDKEQAIGGTEDNSLVVNLSMDEKDVMSRAVQDYDAADYPGIYYLYAADGSHIANGNISGGSFQLSDIPVDKGELTLVMLASPKNNPVSFSTEAIGNYTSQKLTYQHIDQNESNITKDVYRDIVRFTPTIGINEVTGVLTRQNGALEIRIKNMNIKEATLVLNGTQTMYVHDGTGGQVFSENPVQLTKTMSGLEGQNDIRIRINLLPQEDITTGNTANDPKVDTSVNKLTITDVEGKTTEYPIKSNQGVIPVYPNQVTWLTLNRNGGDGMFEVSFSGDINLDDDDWTGWE